MFFINISFFPFLVFGTLIFFFAKFMGKRQIEGDPNGFLSIPIINKIFIVWTVRFVGIMGIVIFIYMGINRPYRGMMKKPENRIALLENGVTATGIVAEDSWYDEWAPSAWMILYSFKAVNPSDGEEERYWGSARGPRKYFSSFSKGDAITVIYLPSNPKINCEIYYFINNPNYQMTFREAGMLHLLDRFRGEYEFKRYSIMSWFNEARQEN